MKDDDLLRVSTIVSRVSGAVIPGPTADLAAAGVKSIDMLRIVGALETEFGIEFDDTQLTRANFCSVRAIGAAIASALAAADGIAAEGGGA